MNKKAILFLILFAISFFISLFFNIGNIKIPYFKGIYKEVQTDVIFKTAPPKIFYDNEEIKTYLKIDENHYLYNIKKNKLINNIKFQSLENIEELMIYVGNDVIFLDKNTNEIEINNNKTLLDKITISVLSFFYNPQYYLISYIFLLLFLYNFQFHYKTKAIFISLIALGFIFRITQLNSIPFWDDEVYILTHTNKWLETFQDPGNPPLYFILFKIYRTIFQNPDFYRFSSVIIGVLLNLYFYIYLKSTLSKKHALIGLFITTFSIVLIYYSQEIRCYILLMFLAIINSYFLFKFNNKRKLHYLISTTAILYTHFYAAFFVLYNFIFGCSLFHKNKNKLKNFIIINFISVLFFIPLIIYKKTSITSDFNTWMQKPNAFDFIATFSVFTGKILLTLLFFIICLWIYKKLEKKRIQLIFFYSYMAILSVFILALIFTYFIKPIFYYKYFYVVFPCYLTLLTIVIAHNYKDKLKNIIPISLFLLFTTLATVNYQNLYNNHNLYLKYVKNNLNKEKNNYVFYTDTVKNYEKFNINYAKQIYVQVDKGIFTIDVDKHDIKPPANIYALNLYLEENTYKKAKKIKLFKTPLGVFCKIEL